MTAEEQAAADAAKAKADAEVKAKADADAKLKQAKEQLEQLRQSGLKIYSEEEMLETIKARQELKEKLRVFEEAKEKETREKAIAEGKTKELLDSTVKEFEATKAELAKFREREKLRREMLLKKLPDGKRELYATVDVDVLEDLIETLDKAKKPGTGAAPPGSGSGKTYDDMTSEERNELKTKEPERYSEMFREWYKKKNGIYPPFHV